MNRLELTDQEVENLYDLVKKTKEFPKELLIKIEDIIDKNYQMELEEMKLYEERLERYNSDPFLQKVFKTLKDVGYKFDLNEFMEDVEERLIRFFNSIDEWFEYYMDSIDDYVYMEGEFRLLIDLEITENDKGKTIRDKYFEFKLKEFSDSMYVIDGKVVICY